MKIIGGEVQGGKAEGGDLGGEGSEEIVGEVPGFGGGKGVEFLLQIFLSLICDHQNIGLALLDVCYLFRI